jgi:hypothetical protein
MHVFVRRAGQRMQNNFAVPVLPAPAGLLDVFADAFRLLANRLAVRHLRPPDVGLHVVLAQHAVHDDFQVQFAHPGNQRLSGVRLRGHPERGVFLRQPLQRHAQFVLVRFGLGLDGHGNYRRGKINRL